MRPAASTADFTGKGRADILLGCIRGTNHLLRNNGDGTFTDMTEIAGLDQRVFNTRATAILDFNRDGAPDVVFVNEGQDSNLLLGRPREVADAGQKSGLSDATTAAASTPGGSDPGAPSGGGLFLRSGLAILGILLSFGVVWALIPRRAAQNCGDVVPLACDAGRHARRLAHQPGKSQPHRNG